MKAASSYAGIATLCANFAVAHLAISLILYDFSVRLEAAGQHGYFAKCWFDQDAGIYLIYKLIILGIIMFSLLLSLFLVKRKLYVTSMIGMAIFSFAPHALVFWLTCAD